MKRHTFYLATLLGKYRSMTSTQLMSACDTVCKKSVFYDNLASLKKLQVIQRVCHDVLPLYGYLARPELDLMVGRPSDCVYRPIRTLELGHAFAVTDALMELSRYANVKEFAHECELSPEAAVQFSGKRRPDGILQIQRGQWTYEVALEVETSMQTHERVRNTFSIYRDLLSNPKSLCSGVLFVLHPRCDASIYQAERDRFPSEHQSKVLILTPDGLSGLREEFFGQRSVHYGMDSGMKSGKVRVHSGGHAQYLPVQSTLAHFELAHLLP